MHFAASLNDLGRWLAERLWPLSVELAVLAAIVAGVTVALRLRSPATRHLFWWMVLAKPVATFLIASPLSLYAWLRPAMPAPAPAVRSAAMEPWSSMPAWPARNGARPARAEGAPPAAQPSDWAMAWRMLDAYGLAAAGWLVVAGTLSARLLAGFVYVGFLRRTARSPAGGPLTEALASARRALPLRRAVRAELSDVTGSPLLAGIFRPVILVPARLADGLSASQLELVVCHELAHVRRWDNLALLVQRLAEIVLFFHPAVWLCGWVMRREAEAACDEAVLAARGRREQYADSLTRVAELRGACRNRLLVNTFAADESDFARRVRRILRGKAARSTLAASIASVVAMVVIGCLGLPGAGQSGTSGTSVRGGNVARGGEEKPMAASKAKIIRDGDKVYIDGFQKDAYHMRNSIIATTAAAMSAIGEDASYEYLMGVSGQAFRTQFHQTDGCPSSACAPCGYNTMNVALGAMGYDVTWYLTEKDRGSQELARAAVVRAVDAGRPALLASDETGLLVGYAKGGQELLCREYYMVGKPDGYTVMEK